MGMLSSRRFAPCCSRIESPKTPCSVPPVTAFGQRFDVGDLERVLVRPPLAEDADAGASTAGDSHPTTPPPPPSTSASAVCSRRPGAEVIVSRHDPGNPDAIYVYDPVLVGTQGAVLLRPGKEGRRSEPDAIAASLVAAGVPIVGALAEPAAAEGGDTVWLDAHTLLVGRRLSHELGRGAGTGAAPSRGVEVIAFDLPHWNGRGEVHAPHELHLAARPRPRPRVSAHRAGAAPRAPGRAGDQGRRGPRRRVREPGAERARAGAAAGARTRRQPGDAPPNGAGRGRRRRLPRRGDLKKGDGGPTCLTRPLLRA